MKNKKTLFIVLEGGDRCGKTSQANLLALKLEHLGFKVITTVEPGKTELGKDIRNILLYSQYEIDPIAETLLFLASRVQNIKEIISPAMGNYDIIICDRYTLSTMVYQGIMKKVPVEIIKQFHKTINIPKPDLTFILNISSKTFLERGRDKSDRFESKSYSFQENVRRSFLRLSKTSKTFHLINGEKSKNEIQEEMIKIIMEKFGDKIINA